VIKRDEPEAAEASEARMSLLEHLTELRSRLWKCVIAVGILGGVSMVYAREIFEILMRPVLAALPEDGRALVYTSGIEEINVLLKVGLYAGVFLAAPVILYQLWAFVAPGLYKHERKMVGPFVTMGTIFFIGGAVFCYFAVLPTMFQFLLTEGDEHEVRNRAVLARADEGAAARLLLLGQKDDALKLIAQARGELDRKGDGKVEEPMGAPGLEELQVRDNLLGARVDAAVQLAFKSEPAHAAAMLAVQKRAEAETELAQGKRVNAAAKQDEAAKQVSVAFEAALGNGYGTALDDLWRLDRHLGMAQRRVSAQEWTRPMLTMREQLSLVLLLEVAFGIIFELPLIMALLSWMGLVKPAFLAKYQRHAILLCVILAAIITPSGDAVNLALMAGPMIVCYELGVLAAYLVARKRDARQKTPQLTVVQGGGKPPEK
jgi:sec-independent protein translocase protein TatC